MSVGFQNRFTSSPRRSSRSMRSVTTSPRMVDGSSRSNGEPLAPATSQHAKASRSRTSYIAAHRGHPPPGGGPDHRGHAEADVALGVGGELGRRRRLHAQVELALHDPLEMPDDRLRPQPPREGRQELDHPGGEVEGVDVAQEGALDARAQHLDRHRLPGRAQRRAVDLRQRGGGDRRLELGEDLVERLAELVLDRRPRLLHREGRQLVLQHRQLGGELGPDDVRPGREELAELDVGRPERRQRPQDRRLARVALVARATGTASRARARPPAAPAARRRPRAPSASRRCARRWRRCGSGARGCAGRASRQSFQAECSAAMPMERLR